MATELVGGAFISASIQLLLEKIASPEVVNYLLGKKEPNLDFLLKRLKMMVSSLAAVLDDADQRQIRDDPRVEEWLDGVQEAVFDSDDLLDEIATDAALLEPRETKRRKKIFSFFRRSSGDDDDVEGKVRKLIERLEDIAKQKELLGLKERAETGRRRRWQKLPSTSLVEDSEVFGRDEDKDVIIKLLLSDDSGGRGGGKICVIPISGMGGVGKTTVAQAVFNDERVRERFQVKSWVYVSEKFDICRITSTLLQSESNENSDADDLNSLQVRLRERLSGKRFLIVLDDVWNEDYLDWDALRKPFKDGARGSKIIVSTRSERVASIMGSVPSHRLKGLSEESCWRLFARHASSGGGVGDFSKNPALERIGREIVGKCNGLPLAVKTVGGVLRSTVDVREWERVSRSDLWDLSDVRRKILPALRLSYNYLPSPLKRCFAYCAIFPKDYKFDKEELILLWMAENLLDYPRRRRRMEDVGEEYFDGLVSRSFFQESTKTDSGSVFVMHDLLVDLAKSVSRKYCFLSETSGSLNDVSVSQARHFAYVRGQHDPYERFSSVFGATHLRTIFPVRSMFSYVLSKEVVDDLFSKLRCLRVLSLSGYKNTVELPDSIGELIHLRYLNLSSTSISCLPESTTTLYNLQTLRLAFCSGLTELPKDFHCLANLRYLDITASGLKELPESLSLLSNLQTLKLSRCRSLTELPREFHRLVNLRKLEVAGAGLVGMPRQMRELTSLQTLSTFFLGKEIGAEIGELGGLSDLGGTLHIKNLQNVAKPEDAWEAKLREKRYLEGLRLEWGNRTDVSKHEMDVLEYLVPNTALKKLELICYADTEFSKWLGDRSFSNVVEICLMNCSHCLSLPPLGQLPSLKNLQIKGLDSVVRVGSEFYGKCCSTVKPFASLEVLEIKQMPKWKQWSSASVQDSEAFPELRKLSIHHCNNLRGSLPSFLPSLTELAISMCDKLVPSLPTMPNLSKLELKMCQNLSRATEPQVVESFGHLRHLEISANSLSIRLNGLPPTIKTLKVLSYRRLEFQIQQSVDSLEELSIECSDEGSFKPGFALDSFPNVRKLRVVGCQNLESMWGWSSEGLKFLSDLEIANCHDQTILFPKSGAPLPSLSSLTVRNCKRLKLLSEQLHSLAPSLESLAVRSCPEMEAFSKSGGLPSTLRWLNLAECDKLVSSRRKWNLQRLGELRGLILGEFECADMESFPEEGMLPRSVTELSIWYLEDLETLDNEWLRKLDSLKQLTIYDCPDLQRMTEAALPASVESLRINNCPLLQEKCRKGVGVYWDKISHIPWIYFDYKLVT